MDWKSVKRDRPQINVMERSRYDLIIFDGYDYHRGFAEAKLNGSPFSGKPVYEIKYFSHETGNYIEAVKFMEILPAEKNIKLNIWRTIWKK